MARLSPPVAAATAPSQRGPGALPPSAREVAEGRRERTPRRRPFPGLALDSAHRDALREVLLEGQEHDDDGHGCQRGTGHDQAVVGGVLGLQLGDTKRDRQLAGAGQHDQLHEVIVPRVDEGEDGQCADARLDHGQRNADKGLGLARAVDAGGLQHLAGDALTELLHQEYAERPADDGEDDRPDRVVELQAAHLAQQGDQDDLLRQRHGADDQGKEDAAAHKALFCQRIACHGGGDAGQDHRGNGHKDRVDEPAHSGGHLGTGPPDDVLAVRAEVAAERHRELPQWGLLAAEQLVIVRRDPLARPPFGGGGVDGDLRLKGARQDPVQRERERDGQQDDDDGAEHHVGGNLLFFLFGIHSHFPPS